MPELLEVEYYRRAADAVVGRVVAGVDAPDAWYTKGDTNPHRLASELPGLTVTGTRRRGKLLMLDTDGPVLGLRFGMTGRLVVDAAAPIARLEYASHRDEPTWDRFTLRFTDGGALRVNDPRRLGGIELDPEEDALGPDALTVTPRQLDRALARGSAPLKARLLDQAHLAGVGNLLADEVLWRAGLDPARAVSSLSAADRRRLHRVLRRTLTELLARGGSHTGDLQPERRSDGRCPRDGTPLQRRTIGGRTTFSCPAHQH